MANNIAFESNQSTNGTSNAEILYGNDTAGNTNDIVYGYPGDDTIYGIVSLNNSTLYGGQGDDHIYANNQNVVYGQRGNDVLRVYGDDSIGPYGSNNTLYGGQGDDTIAMYGYTGYGTDNVAYGGTGNSFIYAYGQAGDTLIGGLGNSTIDVTFSYGLVVYGNRPGAGIYGNDTMEFLFTSDDTVYGGQGNDSIYSAYGGGNTFYGGGGNDTIDNEWSYGTILYGAQGNDTISTYESNDQTAYGGQGNDFMHAQYSANSILYGQKGNDLIYDANQSRPDDSISGGQGSSVLYGGLGNDTMVTLGSGGDSMWGGQGNDLFAGNDFLLSSDFDVNHMLTVGDFANGSDHLALSSEYGGNIDFQTPGYFLKLEDLNAGNATAALNDANNYYTNDSNPAQYLFVYGGSGSGYLFYNGDSGGSAPNDGMILLGDNAESDLSANDIVTSNKLNLT